MSFPIQYFNLCTDKSFSEVLIFASTNPQYDDRFFIELQVQYMKITSSSLGRTCCVQKLFLTFRAIFVHNMFSPCFEKRRVSDKDLPLQTHIHSPSNLNVKVKIIFEQNVFSKLDVQPLQRKSS